ncbi:SRPBCC family protein [Glaciibacter psychrotolerans]|uniref:Uncharacterized protein YndB with AHSA1/START domain n=1 Tax=Glaciibacter psychrotolerans TaxID=670054 RepID=A0A7Z0EFP7_9MICO|nr:SRPBCC domain-containing protein [Leifsonia psychrotolerans]NYJ20823.1 uncharacterized protein YndB with AHSA1/START domain [Leifsonia psychrotolerans]
MSENPPSTAAADAVQPGITITRILSAPCERVFAAWIEPAQFAEWFGSRAAEIPVETISMDVRPGGTWSATMFAGPDRREIPWTGTYREVDPPKRLVFTLTDQTDEEAVEVVTVSFDDLDGMTEMTFTQGGNTLTEEQYDGARQGWLGFFDTLAEVVVRD